MQLLTSLSTKGKVILGACGLAFMVTAFLLVNMAGAPSYVTVMAGVDPAQTGKITQALTTAGVGFEIQSNGTAIAVDQAQVGAANIALASAGLTGVGKQPGYELLDKQKLGASNFQQQVAYQRALEGQIANTIGQIQGVSGAQVSLTLPKDQLFADQAQPATAAVLLGSSGSLDPGAVRGIASLVASSVQGLKTADVTITDSTGQMLWPTGDSAGGATSKPAAEARYNQQLASTLNAMLTTALGPGKGYVQVHSDLNLDRSNLEKLQYAKKGTALRAVNETETLKGTGGAGGGAAGTATNIPSYAQSAATGGAGSTSNYKHTTKSTDFGVDKTITKTEIAPGAVNRLDVALVLDAATAKKLGPAAVKSLQASVASAAGIQKVRTNGFAGDTFAVSQVAFPAPPKVVPPASGLPVNIMSYAKTGLLGLAALLFLFFVSRHLRKRQTGAFTEEPSWLRELGNPAGGGHLLNAGGINDAQEALDSFNAQEAARKVFANDPRAIALDDIVAREPEKIAQHLRTWITEGES